RTVNTLCRLSLPGLLRAISLSAALKRLEVTVIHETLSAYHMIRRFFIWRAQKRMGLSPYRLDKRQYRGVFKAGFMSRNGGINFWATDDDPIRRRRRRRKKWFAV